MARTDEDTTRAIRLKRAFHAFVKGERPVASSHDATLFLEAVRSQPEPAACLEAILGGKSGAHAVRQSVRASQDKTFVCQSLLPFVSYLSHPDAKAMCEGSLLQQLIAAIVVPPTAWKCILKLYGDHDFLQAEQHTEVFAWLCLQVVAHPGKVLAEAAGGVVQALEKRPLLSLPWAKVREVGYQIQKVLEIKQATDGKSSADALGVNGPGGRHDNDFADFRETSIYPTTDEFSSTLRPFYRTAGEVAATDSESRTARHLDNQFRLLREDMLAELREDIKTSFSAKKKGRQTQILNGLDLVGIDAGDDRRGQLCSLKVSIGGGFKVPGEHEAARKKWLKDNPKVLRHQTFGALCCGNETFGFAFIVRDMDDLSRAKPVVGLRFPNALVVKTALAAFQQKRSLRFVIVDTPVFAYEPVLQRLKDITDLPLRQHLLQLDHLDDSSDSDESASGLEQEVSQFTKTARLENSSEGLQLQIGDKDYRLDQAQANALICALESPVSVIQGPPGTGKSFIGALAAKLLFSSDSTRLLVLAYTNHALDQFLEDLRNVGIGDQSMVRLGSKPSPATENLSFETQFRASEYQRSRTGFFGLSNLRREASDTRLDLQTAVAKMIRQPSLMDVMEHLEFDQDRQSHIFWGAFQVPDQQDGFTMAGQGGANIQPSYLLDRWASGQDPGVFKPTMGHTYRPIWKITVSQRTEMMNRWLDAVRQEHIAVVSNLVTQLDTLQHEIEAIFNEGRRSFIKTKRVVGCTTTAAAKYASLLMSFQPTCVLVEEAGEIMESHILTALSPGTRRIILIGDHKQLRPKCNNYALSVEWGEGYDLNRSLFERLILDGHPFATLRKQHRMIPEISNIIRSMTYPDLLDDAKTLDRPQTRGICSRVSFINHSNLEGSVREIGDRRDAQSSGSKENAFEARLVLKLVKYLAQQGYTANQIVVLTPYLGQLRLLRDMLSVENDPVLSDLDSAEFLRAGLITHAAAKVNKAQIRLSTIDNYQGEESDIVIASLTRGNNTGDIGFMKAPERLNVLVSRARNCLLMIGNMETFLASKQGKPCWKPFFNLMKEKQYLYDGLQVHCDRHPGHRAVLAKPEDFDTKCPDGGCTLACSATLRCGLHTCDRRCHRMSDHSQMSCPQLIDFTCEKQHKYKVPCGETQTACVKCRQEQEDIQRRVRRDLEIEKQRLSRQSRYREELKALQDQIAHQKRLLKDSQEKDEEERLLAEEQATLCSLKDTTARQESKRAAEDAAERLKEKSSNKKQPRSHDDPEDKAGAQYDWACMKRDELAKSVELDTLMGMIGLETVKQCFLDIKTMVDTSTRQGVSLKDDRFGCSLLGNPGTGKTTVARLYGKFLTSMGVIAGHCFKETTGSKLANMGVNGCQSLIDEVLGTGGGVIFVDEAYQLSSGNSPGGKAVLDFLLAEVENLRSKVCFILAGYAKQMESFFAHNPGFPSRFPLEMKFDDYTDEELLRILELQVNSKYGGRMTAEGGLRGLYCRIVAQRLGRGRGKEGFGNARAVENALSKVYRRQGKRLQMERRAKKKPDDLLLTQVDMIGPKPSNALLSSQTWTKLQELIGLDSVKESVRSLVDTIEANYERELEEKPIIEYSLNRVFLGNPGTGKTTVAKIYGQILVDLGMLSNGEVIVKNPSDLVGSVLGQSEELTKGILANAAGKVLVIDEAYAMYGGGGTVDIYKTAVIDTIVATVHSTPGDDRCVLLLGYKDQMEEMFQNVNPGLTRRFPLSSAFEFADFDQKEIAKIMDLKVKQQGFELTVTAKTVALSMLDRVRNRPNFGNAGEVDILLDVAKGRHQKRLTAGSTKRISTLEALDFDPDYSRIERSDTNVAALFKDTVGCERIVATLQGYQETVRKMTALGLDPKENIPFNFLFRGPPGTGKTTTARKMGKVFYDAGFLASAEVLDCSASDLIGQYIGQTGPKVRQMLDKALGRVLLIDEAYRLREGQFAKEALDEIVDACTKERYYKRLIIVLAGYEEDINRLLNVNPGMTSRFPEVLDFYALGPQECLDLLTKKLHQKKLLLEQPGNGTLNLQCLMTPSQGFQSKVKDRFERLSSQASWASARDVETLYMSIFKSALSKSPDGTEINISKSTVEEEMDRMLKERGGRAKQSASSMAKVAESLLRPQSQDPKIRAPVATTVATKASEVKKNESDDEITQEAVQPRRQKAVRDDGVSDEVWDQLQEDTKLEQEREREYQAKLKAKNEAMDDLLRQQIVMELIQEEERRKKEAEMKKKLEMQGLCPMGYEWVRQATGWRCAGGSHFVSGDDAMNI